MRCHTEAVRVPYASPLVHDFLYGFERVRALYAYDPHDPESLARRYRWLRDRWRGDRSGLVRVLDDYNRRLGAGPRALENAARLGRPETVAVVAGQQAGVLTGPLYTVYKAMSAVLLARRCDRELGIPAVPVFWISAEDHDFAEVDHVHLITPDHRLARLALDEGPPGKWSVGHVPVSGAVFRLLDAVEAHTAPTEFRPAMLDTLRRLAEASDNLADWFGRVMAWLFGDAGLVLANPLLPGLRRLQSEALAAMIRRREATRAALEAAEARLAEAGYAPAVERKDPGALHLFTYVDGERLPLLDEAGAFVARGSGRRFTEAELLRLAETEPTRLSTNVVLRPIAQDAVFPNLATLCGPGEIQYYAQFTDVYPVFDLEQPVLVPRPNVTLVERVYRGYLEKYGLSYVDVVTDLEARQRQYLAARDTIGLERLLSELRRDIAGRMREVGETLAALDPNLKTLATSQLGRMMGLVGQLEEKAWQRLRQREEIALRQFEKLGLHLFPGGTYQERVLNWFGYAFKYGPDLLGHLMAEPLLDGVDHKFVVLEG